MTVRADSGVASILIPKTIQNRIRGCFISHPKKTVQNGIRADSGVASILIPKTVQNGIRGCFISHPKKKVQNSSFKTELGVASFFIPKSFHI
jgi:hypothetical protein